MQAEFEETIVRCVGWEAEGCFVSFSDEDVPFVDLLRFQVDKWDAIGDAATISACISLQVSCSFSPYVEPRILRMRCVSWATVFWS